MYRFNFGHNRLDGHQQNSCLALVVAGWIVLAVTMLAIDSDLSKAFANSAPDMNVAGEIGTRGFIEVNETSTTVVDVATTDDSDSEGSGLTYELTNDPYVRDGVTLPEDNDDFSIDASTGVLSFISTADFESPADSNADNVYTVNIKVTDSGGLSDYFFLTITVRDVDETVPSLSFVAPANHTGQPFDVSVQANKSISHLNPQIGDVTIDNGTAVEVINGCWLCLRVTPASNAPVTITIPANTVTDLITGQVVAGAAQAIVVYDATSPTIESITRQNPSPTGDDSLTWRVTFSEQIALTGLDGSFTVTGTTATVSITLVDPLRDIGTPVAVEVVDVSISGGDLAGLEGNVVLNFDPVASGLKDYSGIAFMSSVPTGANETTYAVTQDTRKPSVQIQNAPASYFKLTPFTVTFEWSEDVVGFTIDDITLTNAATSDFTTVDGNTYTAVITPDGSGNVTIDVAAAVAQDLAGNDNTAATPVAVGSKIVEETQKAIVSFMQSRAKFLLGNQPDLLAYLLGLNGNGGGPLGNLDLNGNEDGLNLAFSTSLSKLDREEAKSMREHLAERHVEDTGTSYAGLPGTSSKRVAESVFSRALRSEIDAGSAVDGPQAGQPASLDRRNMVGSQLPPGSQLDGSKQNTAGIYGAQQPTEGTATLAERMTPMQSVPVGVNQDSGTYAADLTGLDQYASMPLRRYDVWTEIYGSRSSSGDIESSYWAGYLGAHYFVSPDFLVGAHLQFDWADEDNENTGASADGFGWMIGPYIAGRIAGTSLGFEAKASWGRSDNNISPFGTYTDSFETERMLLSGKLQGSFSIDTLTITPSVRVSWFKETQESYTDSLSNKIPEQTISLGELRFGPEFSQSISLPGGSVIVPTIGISGVWNFDIATNNASQPAPLGSDDLRARVDAGISLTNALGWQLIASGYYDGLGVASYEAIGGKVRLTIPIQ